MPTTNNNWPTPVATDLVKDGWEAIKDLGDAIDTTLGVYSPATPGLVHINTSTYSAQSAVSVNDVFSATYDNYRIVINFTASNAFALISFRLRVSGADNSNSDYYRAAVSKDSASATINNENADPTTSYRLGTTGSNNTIVTLDISNPFQSISTAMQNNCGALNNGNEGSWFTGGGGFGSTTSFTGFSIFPSGGTITGTILTYGYKK